MTDHAEQSRNWLVNALTYITRGEFEAAAVATSLAKVNATLALAAEQRTANLIAYKQLHTGRRLTRDRDGRWDVDDLPVSSDDLTTRIEAALWPEGENTHA